MDLSFRESGMDYSISRIISFDGQNISHVSGNDNDKEGRLQRSPKRSRLNTSSEYLLLTPSKSLKNGFEPTSITPSRNQTRPCEKSPQCSGDRFIPNRAHMHMDLCRASIQSAEKSRLAAIDKQASGLSSNIENRDPSHEQRLPREEVTPLQAEFRNRMRDAMLNFNSGGTSSKKASTVATTKVDIGENQLTTSVKSESTTNLVYADIADIEEKFEDIGSKTFDHRARMLSFRYISSTQKESTASYSELTPTKKQGRLPSSSWLPNVDPFSHDQLHVLQRSSQSSPFHPAPDSGLVSATKLVGRKINAAPTRILDAPELVDDYYLNLISWGRDNILAVALGQCVYLWNAASGQINHLLTLTSSDDYVTSVQWCDMERNSNYIAVGTNHGPVQVWDASATKKLRTMNGHTSRVGALSWSQFYLSSGGRDSVILQHDVRSPMHIVSTYSGHTQEVCGLKWNEDGSALASGGNENYLCIWDSAMSGARLSNDNADQSRQVSPRLLLNRHNAAVKALAWCPFHRGLLASGGGTADGTIKFWNSNSGSLLNSVDTGSQVCSLLWSKHQREICSSHGFSENQLVLWKYPMMTRIQEFKGHTARVLHTDQNPDGSCVVSAAADETLRFWDIFGPAPSKVNQDSFTGGNLSSRLTTIR